MQRTDMSFFYASIYPGITFIIEFGFLAQLSLFFLMNVHISSTRIVQVLRHEEESNLPSQHVRQGLLKAAQWYLDDGLLFVQST